MQWHLALRRSRSWGRRAAPGCALALCLGTGSATAQSAASYVGSMMFDVNMLVELTLDSTTEDVAFAPTHRAAGPNSAARTPAPAPAPHQRSKPPLPAAASPGPSEPLNAKANISLNQPK